MGDLRVTTLVKFPTDVMTSDLQKGLNRVLFGEPDFQEANVTVDRLVTTEPDYESIAKVSYYPEECKTGLKVETCFIITRPNGERVLVHQDGTSTQLTIPDSQVLITGTVDSTGSGVFQKILSSKANPDLRVQAILRDLSEKIHPIDTALQNVRDIARKNTEALEEAAAAIARIEKEATNEQS